MTTAELDEGLVRALQQDGRVSFSDLARQLGVSRAVVGARVSELTESGHLRIVAAVHPRVLGLNALAHLSITVSRPAGEVAEQLKDLDGCVFVSLTSGAAGIVAEFRHPGMPDLYAQIDAVRAVPGVERVDVLLYRDIAKSLFLSAEPPTPGIELDETDLDLMTVLQRDGRIGFEALGREIGLSTSAARTRVLRLLGARVMQIGAIRTRKGDTPSFAVGFGVRTRGPADEAVAFFATTQGVEFVTTCFGRFDLVATVGVTTPAEALRLMDDARALASVASVESWVHLAIVQERYERPLEAMPRGPKP
ncbi:Lrp/AsnC family transcriptional regulator [Sinomonas sp. ASV322]|uniref:Lrp/AsnC family transcriptional regulator n=1 Tax=Sinomonas sp. ASV322 TaxID=3041920 RepID=UPI0027DD51EE|nr:Lrp/AsnC family transcriptional regulator [Sinomonas sp. ASV322]MDQ4503874.1 Lrp/AsnC family transcriptional regulator [Sinomonas sp. ASV322]